MTKIMHKIKQPDKCCFSEFCEDWGCDLVLFVILNDAQYVISNKRSD